MSRVGRFITFAVVAVLTLSSCAKEETLTMSKDLSLCAFILADNDLDDNVEYIEWDLVKGLRSCPPGTELFLYVDRLESTPSLRQLYVVESGQVAVKTIANYQEQCSTSPQVFADVLGTMLQNASGNRYGLIIWSHGSGWLPGIDSPSGKSTRSIGADGIYSMNVDDLADVLSGLKTPSYILLDACYMGAVEVAYSLRNAADYLIASSAETLGVNFPYHLILPDLIAGNVSSLSHALDKYLDFCHTDFYGDGTISGMASLIDCSLMDGLASAYRGIVNSDIENVSADTIQAFDNSNPHQYFDLAHYTHSIAKDSSALCRFDSILNRTVVHKVTTPTVFTFSSLTDSLVTINRFCGLSTYIPGTSAYQDYSYSGTQWSKYCYEE